MHVRACLYFVCIITGRWSLQNRRTRYVYAGRIGLNNSFDLILD